MGRPQRNHTSCEYCRFRNKECDCLPVLCCELFQPGWNWGNYLSTAHWHEVRIKKIIATGYTCEICHRQLDANSLHVHHKRYDTLFNESPEDLQTVCVSCHARIRMERFKPDV